MSLLVALKGKDGVVFASDSQVTRNSFGGPVKHEKQKKIFKIGKQSLFGATGTISLIQKSFEAVKLFRKDFERGMDEELTNKVTKALLPILKNANEMYRAYHGTNEGAPSIAITICAKDKSGNLRILNIGKDCNDEFVDTIGYVCTGGADILGYAFLKNYDLTTFGVEKCALLAYRVVKDAISVSAFGLSEPIDVWIVRKGAIRRLSNADIDKLKILYLRLKNKESKIFSEYAKVRL
jgi:20S proteasome alpha/beta subunit